MSWKPFLYVLIPLLVVVVIALWIHLSTWFLWSLLPESDIKIALNYTQPGTAMISDLLLLSPLHGELQPVINQARRIAYLQNNDASAIAVIPSNPFLFSERSRVKQQLIANNWQTSSYGLIIIGKKGPTPVNSLPVILRETYRKLYSRQFPYQPAVIAVNKSDALSPGIILDAALIGVATNRGQEIKFAFAQTLSDLPVFSITSPPLPAGDDYLSLNLSGTNIQSIVAQFNLKWDDLLSTKLGLIKTKPALTALLASQQTVSLTISGSNISIAMIGEPNTLKNTISHWLSNEEAFSRPQKNAFKLPDGTLGYELVKGPLLSVLSEPDQTGCQAPASPNVKLWLCQSSQGVSFGTSQSSAQQALSAINPSQQAISIGRQYLSKLDFPIINRIQSLVLFNADPYTILTVQLR